MPVAVGDDGNSAGRAYRELTRQARSMEQVFRHIDDEALRSLSRRIRHDLAENVEPARSLWAGIADCADAELTVRGRWDSELGTWYAVATRFTVERPASRFADGATVEYVECRGRANAEKAAQALRREYANEFSVTGWVSVDIYPAAAWVVPEDEEVSGDE